MDKKVEDQGKVMTQIESKVKREKSTKEKKERAAKEKKQEKEDKTIYKISGKKLKDLGNHNFDGGFREGQLQILKKQLQEKEIEEAIPITLAEQLKELEEKIKYQRSKAVETLNNKKAITILTSTIMHLQKTIFSLQGLEKKGLKQFISRSAYEKELRDKGQRSRINSTTRDNLKYLVFILEQLHLLLALHIGGNELREIPAQLYPEGKRDVQRYIRKELKSDRKRQEKAEAELKKQEKE